MGGEGSQDHDCMMPRIYLPLTLISRSFVKSTCDMIRTTNGKGKSNKVHNLNTPGGDTTYVQDISNDLADVFVIRTILLNSVQMCNGDWCFTSLSTIFQLYHDGGCLLHETRYALGF